MTYLLSIACIILLLCLLTLLLHLILTGRKDTLADSGDQIKIVRFPAPTPSAALVGAQQTAPVSYPFAEKEQRIGPSGAGITARTAVSDHGQSTVSRPISVPGQQEDAPQTSTTTKLTPTQSSRTTRPKISAPNSLPIQHAVSRFKPPEMKKRGRTRSSPVKSTPAFSSKFPEGIVEQATREIKGKYIETEPGLRTSELQGRAATVQPLDGKVVPPRAHFAPPDPNLLPQATEPPELLAEKAIMEIEEKQYVEEVSLKASELYGRSEQAAVRYLEEEFARALELDNALRKKLLNELFTGYRFERRVTLRIPLNKGAMSVSWANPDGTVHYSTVIDISRTHLSFVPDHYSAEKIDSINCHKLGVSFEVIKSPLVRQDKHRAVVRLLEFKDDVEDQFRWIELMTRITKDN